MSFGKYLSAGTVRLDGDCANRKKALEELASLLSERRKGPSEQEILKCLLEREKLGSTGLGHGIAVPHCRIPGVNVPRAALLRVRKGVDFDAPDDVPVLLFCALIVDTEAADEHLRIFADLVSLINEEAVKDRLLQASDVGTVLSILSHPAHPAHPAHAT